jgi:hypothetical protein
MRQRGLSGAVVTDINSLNEVGTAAIRVFEALLKDVLTAAGLPVDYLRMAPLKGAEAPLRRPGTTTRSASTVPASRGGLKWSTGASSAPNRGSSPSPPVSVRSTGARPRRLLRLAILRVVSATLRQLQALRPAALPPEAADERPARPDYGQVPLLLCILAPPPPPPPPSSAVSSSSFSSAKQKYTSVTTTCALYRWRRSYSFCRGKA